MQKIIKISISIITITILTYIIIVMSSIKKVIGDGSEWPMFI